jgi:YidC/Oxa1 family membrane protein insertase
MFQTIILAPLYNLLVLFLNVTSSHYLWISVALLTLFVKILLIPLYKKQVRGQIIMQHLQPKLKIIQEKYKDQKEKLGTEMMALYGKYKINPFSSILLPLIQLPVLFGLYWIFSSEITHYSYLLYSFLNLPENINNNFLFSSLHEKSYILGAIAGLSQFFLSHQMLDKHEDLKKAQKESFKNNKSAFGEDFQNAMELQIRYFIPALIFLTSFALPAVIPLYFIVSNIFGVWQEIFIRKPLENKLVEELK